MYLPYLIRGARFQGTVAVLEGAVGGAVDGTPHYEVLNNRNRTHIFRIVFYNGYEPNF